MSIIKKFIELFRREPMLIVLVPCPYLPPTMSPYMMLRSPEEIELHFQDCSPTVH
jgi:hypothetical protein